jgi:predicted small secreted protein
MIRLLLAAVAFSLTSCSTAPPSGLSLEHNGHIGLVPYRVAYQGGKASVAISAPLASPHP